MVSLRPKPQPSMMFGRSNLSSPTGNKFGFASLPNDKMVHKCEKKTKIEEKKNVQKSIMRKMKNERKIAIMKNERKKLP